MKYIIQSVRNDENLRVWNFIEYECFREFQVNVNFSVQGFVEFQTYGIFLSRYENNLILIWNTQYYR